MPYASPIGPARPPVPPSQRRKSTPLPTRVLRSTNHRGSLDDFPNEILLQICANLTGRDIHGLSLTSSRFNVLAESFLYKEVILESSSVLKLARSIVDRSGLSTLIKRLTILEKPLVQKGGCKATYLGLAKAAEAEGLLSGDRSWFHRLGARFGWSLAEISLLLRLLPRLEELNYSANDQFVFREYPQAEEPINCFALDILYKLPHEANVRFACLRKVHIERRYKWYSSPDWLMDGRNMRGVFLLPSLEEFSASGFDDWDDDDRFDNCFQSWLVGKSNVRTIILKESPIGTEGVVNMIRACKALQSFTFEFGSHPWRHYAYGEDCPDFPEIVLALHQQKDTLTHLTLDAEPGHVDYYSSQIADNIAHLRKLKTLFVNARALWGDDGFDESTLHLQDLLPPSIEELGIEGHHPKLVGGLLEISEDPPSLFPRLRTIRLSGMITDWENDDECDGIIHRQFVSAGVDLVFVGSTRTSSRRFAGSPSPEPYMIQEEECGVSWPLVS